MITFSCNLLAYSVWPAKTIKGGKKTIFLQFENIYNSYLPYFSSKINSKKRKFAESSARLIASNCSLPSYSVWPPTSLIGRKTTFYPLFLSFFINISTITCPKSTLKKRNFTEDSACSIASNRSLPSYFVWQPEPLKDDLRTHSF